RPVGRSAGRARLCAVQRLLLLRHDREQERRGARARPDDGGRRLLRLLPARHDPGGGHRRALDPGPAPDRGLPGRHGLHPGGRPTLLHNSASGGASFVATSTSPPASTQPTNSVPSRGHPLFVDFTIDAGRTHGLQPWTPRSLLALAVEAAGFLYDPGQDIIYS